MTDEQIREQLAAIRSTQTGMRNIDPAEGEYVCRLVKQIGARLVLEIGTSNGYSGSWFALGLRQTGGRLITIDWDEGRRALALANFQALGLTPHVDSRLANALDEIHTIDGPLDIVFIDAEKVGYLNYLESVLPKVRPHGLILAHNVVSHAGDLQDFLQRITTDPALSTEIVTVGPQGLSISVKQ